MEGLSQNRKWAQHPVRLSSAMSALALQLYALTLAWPVIFKNQHRRQNKTILDESEQKMRRGFGCPLSCLRALQKKELEGFLFFLEFQGKRGVVEAIRGNIQHTCPNKQERASTYKGSTSTKKLSGENPRG